MGPSHEGLLARRGLFGGAAGLGLISLPIVTAALRQPLRAAGVQVLRVPGEEGVARVPFDAETQNAGAFREPFPLPSKEVAG